MSNGKPERQVVVAFVGYVWQAGRKAQTIRTIPYYITSVNWGDGDHIKSVKFTTDQHKAFAFRRSTAMRIAKAYRSRKVALLEPVK